MCTVANNATRKVAEKDIKCVKMLQIMADVNGNPVYVTPYQYKHVPEEILKGAEPVTPKDNPIWSDANMRIDRGFIHIYGDIEPDDLAYILNHHCAYIGADDTWITNEMIAKNDLPVRMSPRVLGIALCECAIPADAGFLHGETDISGSFRYVDSHAASSVYIKRVAHEFTIENYSQDSLRRIAENLIKEHNAG